MSIYEASITNPKKQLEFYKQLSEQLQQENKILKENAEHNDKVVDKVNWENMLLKKENKQLRDNIRQMDNSIDKLQKQLIKEKDNWTKLREFIVKEYYMYLPLEASTKSITILTDKMQELEQGIDINVKD